jgi:hypothetical protein
LGILDFTELGTKVWVMTGGVHGFVQTWGSSVPYDWWRK